MKKLFAVILALIVVTSAYAKFGIIGGFTSSSTKISAAYSEMTSKNLNQFHVGVAYKIPIVGIFAIQPALIYNVKGASTRVDNVSDLNFKTGFIELPVQVQFGLVLPFVRPYLFAEPFIGYAVNNSSSVTLDTTWDNIKTRFEYGIGIGAGIEAFKHIQLSVRYYWNLGKLYDFSWNQVGESIVQNGNCNGISASLGIFF